MENHEISPGTFHLLAIPINFLSPYNPDFKLVLKFMLLVPKISKNLFSMSKAARDNCLFRIPC